MQRPCIRLVCKRQRSVGTWSMDAIEPDSGSARFSSFCAHGGLDRCFDRTLNAFPASASAFHLSHARKMPKQCRISGATHLQFVEAFLRGAPDFNRPLSDRWLRGLGILAGGRPGAGLALPLCHMPLRKKISGAFQRDSRPQPQECNNFHLSRSLLASVGLSAVAAGLLAPHPIYEAARWQRRSALLPSQREVARRRVPVDRKAQALPSHVDLKHASYVRKPTSRSHAHPFPPRTRPPIYDRLNPLHSARIASIPGGTGVGTSIDARPSPDSSPAPSDAASPRNPDGPAKRSFSFCEECQKSTAVSHDASVDVIPMRPAT